MTKTWLVTLRSRFILECSVFFSSISGMHISVFPDLNVYLIIKRNPKSDAASWVEKQQQQQQQLWARSTLMTQDFLIMVIWHCSALAFVAERRRWIEWKRCGSWHSVKKSKTKQKKQKKQKKRLALEHESSLFTEYLFCYAIYTWFTSTRQCEIS